MSGKALPQFPVTLPSKRIRFKDLPERIKEKISLSRVRGLGEDQICWLWTGGTRKAKQRFKPYRSTSDHADLRDSTGCFERERATPEVRDPRTGLKLAAHRVVYGLVNCVAVEDVPNLSRCSEDRCVSPYHVLAIRLTNAQSKQAALIELSCKTEIEQPRRDPEVVSESAVVGMSITDIVLALQKHRPVTSGYSGNFSWIEEECGIPAGSMTLDLWRSYLAWDAENPEEDDEP